MLKVRAVVTSLIICNGLHRLPSAIAARPSHQRTIIVGRKTLSPVQKLALDFDGVLCASADESSRTAMIAARNVWPSFVPVQGSNTFCQIITAVTALRPVVETGYEIVVLSRLLSDMSNRANKTVTTDSWHIEALNEVQSLWSAQFRDSLLLKYGTTKETLIHAFGSTRDALIRSNPNEWADLNRFYPPVSHALADATTSDNLFIITTKQERFVRLLLQHNRLSHLTRGECGGNTATRSTNTKESVIPPSNVFDLHNRYGSKAEVLRELSRRQVLGPANGRELTIHFVEDRYETLMSVLSQRQAAQLKQGSSGLENVRLYLADWGYNTAEQRAAALRNPDISVIDQQQFAALVQTIA